jgi:hypothetical protein
MALLPALRERSAPLALLPSFASFSAIKIASHPPGPARMPTIRTAAAYPAVSASECVGVLGAAVLLVVGLAGPRSWRRRAASQLPSGYRCWVAAAVIGHLILPYVQAVTPITNANIGAAVTAWATSPGTAATTYGNIADWNTAAVSNTADPFFLKKARHVSPCGLRSDRAARTDSDSGAEPNHELPMRDCPSCVKASKAFGLGASFGLGARAAPRLLFSRAPSRKPRTAASLVFAAALAALGLLCPGTDAQTAITDTAPTIFSLASSYIGSPTSYAVWSTVAVSNIHRPNFRAVSTRSTDGRQLRFAQVIGCSHECISADSVSTDKGKVTMEADFDCTDSTTGVSNCISGAQSAFPFTTMGDIIQVQER